MVDEHNIIGPSSSPSLDKIIVAKHEMSIELKAIGLDKTNPHFRSRFASFEGASEALQPILTKHGFPMPDYRCGRDTATGEWVCVGTLRHTSGQWLSGIAPLWTNKKDMQEFGKAKTYAKRQLLLDLTGAWTGECDDDGNSLCQTIPRKEKGSTDAKALVYEQGAKNAVTDAASKEEALKHLNLVELRAREKKIPADVFKRVKEAFDVKWSSKKGGKK